jgi:excisionase family DNA binding protein
MGLMGRMGLRLIIMTEEIAGQILAELRELKALLTAPSRAVPEHPMSPAEFAAVVGRSEKTVRRWIHRGKLKARHEGRTLLIMPCNALRFLDPRPLARNGQWEIENGKGE